MGFQIMGTEHLTTADSQLNREQQTWVAVGINTLAHAVSSCAHEHGWWDAPDDTPVVHRRNMGEMIALMHSELSEALESWRDREPPLWYAYKSNEIGYTGPRHELAQSPVNGYGELGKPQGIASEFADVIIRILDTCETLNIPIAKALIEKHNYNLTRSYRHGGKRA